jgi:hypothetical protein
MGMRRRLGLLAMALGLATLLSLTLVQTAFADYTDGSFAYTVNTDDSATLTNYTGSDTSVTIPATLGGHAVTAIADVAYPTPNAFYGNSTIQHVTISDGVTYIGSRSFDGCSALQSVTFPSSLETIGAQAFLECENLGGIVLPDVLRSIGSEAFHACFATHNVVFPASVTQIGTQAFAADVLSWVRFLGDAPAMGTTVFQNVGTVYFIKGSHGFGSNGADADAPGPWVPNGTPADGNYQTAYYDTTPPVVHVPANITVKATGPAGAVVSFDTSATDDIDGTDPTLASPASGSTFPVGETTVTVTATDAAGNPASATFRVTVTRFALSTSLKTWGATSVRRNHTYKLSGTISPATAGGKIKVVWKRYYSHAYHTVKTTYVTLSGGKFSSSYKPTRTGTWRVYVYYAGQTTAMGVYKAAKTVYRGFKVK